MSKFTETYLRFTGNLKPYFHLIPSICLIILGVVNCFFSTVLSRRSGTFQMVVGIVWNLLFFGKEEF